MSRKLFDVVHDDEKTFCLVELWSLTNVWKLCVWTNFRVSHIIDEEEHIFAGKIRLGQPLKLSLPRMESSAICFCIHSLLVDHLNHSD